MRTESKNEKILYFDMNIPSEAEHFNAIQNLQNIYQAITMFNDAINVGIRNDIDDAFETLKNSLLNHKKCVDDLISIEIETCKNEIIDHIKNTYVGIFEKHGTRIQ